MVYIPKVNFYSVQFFNSLVRFLSSSLTSSDLKLHKTLAKAAHYYTREMKASTGFKQNRLSSLHLGQVGTIAYQPEGVFHWPNFICTQKSYPLASASSPVVPANFDVTSPVKLVGGIRLRRLAKNGKSKMAEQGQVSNFSQKKKTTTFRFCHLQ